MCSTWAAAGLINHDESSGTVAASKQAPVTGWLEAENMPERHDHYYYAVEKDSTVLNRNGHIDIPIPCCAHPGIIYYGEIYGFKKIEIIRKYFKRPKCAFPSFSFYRCSFPSHSLPLLVLVCPALKLCSL